MQVKLFSLEETNGLLWPPWQWYKFKLSSWGRLQEALPLEQLANCLPRPKHNCGRKEYFDNSGKFALMFLKHELGVSDEKLIEHIDHSMAAITLAFRCSVGCG